MAQRESGHLENLVKTLRRYMALILRYVAAGHQRASTGLSATLAACRGCAWETADAERQDGEHGPGVAELGQADAASSSPSSSTDSVNPNAFGTLMSAPELTESERRSALLPARFELGTEHA